MARGQYAALRLYSVLRVGVPLHTAMVELHVPSLALDCIWPRHTRHGSSHLHQQEWLWAALCVQVALTGSGWALLCFAWRGEVEVKVKLKVKVKVDLSPTGRY